MNKVIYRPSGKAREYSQWACNFYNGCANDCTYCYCKKGFLSRLWSTSPTLKKGLRDNAHAMEVFRKELDKNIEQLRNSYLFFSFTTDPLLPSTRELTIEATLYALSQGVQVSILTKCEEMGPLIESIPETQRRNVAIGFTLTGCDEQESNAATNKERMQAMRLMYILGFRTYASIEPIIDPVASMAAMTKVSDFCELFKVGVLSGTKNYTSSDIREMVGKMAMMRDCKFYLKDSLVSFATLEREKMDGGVFVSADFNLFKYRTPIEGISKNINLLIYYNVLFVNDVACSMAWEIVGTMRKESNAPIFRHMIKKKVNELEKYRTSYEKHIKKNFINDSYFFADAVDNLKDYIMEDVKELSNSFFKLLDGEIAHPELFVKMEVARTFAGLACLLFDKRQKELCSLNFHKLKDYYRLSELVTLVNSLYRVMLDRFKITGTIELSTPENEKMVAEIFSKLTDLEKLPEFILESELNNLTEIE